MAHLMLSRRDGSTVFVNTSVIACLPFGWRHGDRFIDHHGEKGEVMGVARGVGPEAAVNVLWVILDKNRCLAPNHTNGFATYYRARAGEDGSKTSLQRDKASDEMNGIFDLLQKFGDSSKP